MTNGPHVIYSNCCDSENGFVQKLNFKKVIFHFSQFQSTGFRRDSHCINLLSVTTGSFPFRSFKAKIHLKIQNRVMMQEFFNNNLTLFKLHLKNPLNYKLILHHCVYYFLQRKVKLFLKLFSRQVLKNFLEEKNVFSFQIIFLKNVSNIFLSKKPYLPFFWNFILYRHEKVTFLTITRNFSPYT